MFIRTHPQPYISNVRRLTLLIARSIREGSQKIILRGVDSPLFVGIDGRDKDVEKTPTLTLPRKRWREQIKVISPYGLVTRLMCALIWDSMRWRGW